MSIIFDPTAVLRKIASKRKLEKLVTERFSLKKTVLSTIGTDQFPIDKKSVTNVALKTLKGYKARIKKLAGDSQVSAKEKKTEILADPKQLIQRVQNELVSQIYEGIKTKYKGQKARWLPSDADEPRPEHQLYYGKVYTIGEGIGGIEPGDEWGCRCGVEILTDETTLDLN